MNCYNNSYNLHKLKFQWNYPTCNNCKVSNHVHSWLHGSFSTRGKLAPNALATSGGGSCMLFALFFPITSRDPYIVHRWETLKRDSFYSWNCQAGYITVRSCMTRNTTVCKAIILPLCVIWRGAVWNDKTVPCQICNFPLKRERDCLAHSLQLWIRGPSN